jgi:predicted TIM-barrel fold metal-dependent hydrolase
MSKADINCFVGSWPFRKLGKSTFKDLKEVHINNGITTGLVSSLNSIFYNDPFEGDEELHEIIKDSEYHHILTINPALPECLEDIKRGMSLFNSKGIKLFPGYHGYTLNDTCVKILCDELAVLKLPVYIVMRMEDERLNYLMTPRILGMDELSFFVNQHKDLNIILLNMRLSEILECTNLIHSNSNVFFDTSGLKDSLFTIEQLVSTFGDKQILYGSLFPMYCLKSTCFLVDKADISVQSKHNIFSNNMAALI